MSAGFAVAAATAALVDRLYALVIEAVPGASVATLSPANPALKTGEPIVNLSLFRALRNGALTNRDLPTRDAAGRPKAAPAIALDLDYMITFFGDDARLEPQKLLGQVVGGLHAEPTLSRAGVRATIAATPWLAGARLDGQDETIRITPIALAPDAMARLWSEFVNVPYQLTQLYTLTPVIVEVPTEIAPVLPARRIGASAAGTGPIRFGPIVDADDPGLPIRAGGRMAVRVPRAEPGLGVEIDGHAVPAEPGLDAHGHPALLVRLGGAHAPRLRIGAADVRVVRPGRPGEAGERSGGLRALVVPGLSEPPVCDPSGRHVRLALALPAAAGARAALLLYPLDRAAGPARRIAMECGPEPVLLAPVADVRPGRYLASVEIDGLASVLDWAGRYTGPVVTIPEPPR